jgi:hypothetical protein
MRRLATAVLVLVLTSWSSIVSAGSICSTRETIVDLLTGKLGEVVVASGVTSQGALVETFADVRTGSWTIVISAPGGLMCLVAYGSGWRERPTAKGVGPV